MFQVTILSRLQNIASKVCNLYTNGLPCTLLWFLKTNGLSTILHYICGSFISVLSTDTCGVIQDEVYEIVDLPDPENCLSTDRQTMREQAETEKFDPDHYM